MRHKDPDRFLEQHTLPQEIKDSLTEARQIETEDGPIQVVHWHDARLTTVVIHAEFQVQGPYALVGGLYCATAFVLASRQHYDPGKGRTDLLWLPRQRLYGYFDTGIEHLFVYPDTTTWDMIAPELPDYLAGYKDSINPLWSLPLWQDFSFVPDYTVVAGNALLAEEPGEELYDAIQSYLHRHEKPLLRHPFCEELYPLYVILLEMYMHLARHATAAINVLPWYMRGRVLMQRLERYYKRTER